MNHHEFLEEQLPLPHRSLIVPTLRAAYKAADDLASSTPILQTRSAKNNHGRVIAWAVDWALERLITSGEWPYDCDWKPYKGDTGEFLRIKLPNSILVISQVNDSSLLPRHADFRANAVRSNQLLFPGFEEVTSGEPAFLLVHGHKKLAFAHIGLPNPDQKCYIYKTQNLLNELELLNDEKPRVESLDIDLNISIKDHLIKKFRDNHG